MGGEWGAVPWCRPSGTCLLGSCCVDNAIRSSFGCSPAEPRETCCILAARSYSGVAFVQMERSVQTGMLVEDAVDGDNLNVAK